MAKDNESIILVGGRPRLPADQDTPATELPAAGAFVNIKTRVVRNFTNGHLGRMASVAVASDGSRIFTGGFGRDSAVRVWDTKARKAAEPIHLTDDANSVCEVATMTVGPNLAASVGDLVFLIDPNDAGKKANLSLMNGAVFVTVVRPRFRPIVFSPGDRYLACPTLGGGVTIWEVASSKIIYSPNLLPVGADLQNHFASDALAFTKDGAKLVVIAPQQNGDELKPTSNESGGLLLIDIAKKRVSPIGMGHPVATRSFAIHPSEKWIATVGTSRRSGKKNEKESEVRIHDFQTHAFVARAILPAAFYPDWVCFTPDGKKLVTASFDNGKVLAWDFVVR